MLGVKREAEYKPLLYTTTLRNPTRAKCLLNILSNYNGEQLTEKLCVNIMGDLISLGLYRPTKSISDAVKKKRKTLGSIYIGNELLSRDEVVYIMQENYQNHKEFGFPAGWATRFATLYDFPKELGFVYFNYNEKIEFSELGLKLAKSISIEVDNENKIIYQENDSRAEQQVFLHALAKSQRSNPFVRVLNDNVPLILLLQVIKLLNSDPELNNVGIARNELPLLIFRKDNNANMLYKTIKDFRKKYKSKITPEIIIDFCVNNIMGGKYKKFDTKSIIVDYPDEFIRKMRMTGLISLRGGGRYVDINQNETEKIQYILSNYSSYKKYDTEREYFDYMSKIDTNLVKDTTKTISIDENNKQLNKWVNYYKRENIKLELIKLSNSKVSEDGILKYLTPPTRLEFLVSLAIKARYPDVKVIPNYSCDDEGIPTSTAGGVGDKGDIECIEDEKGILVEVTMIVGRGQTIAEGGPVERHFKKYSENFNLSMCYFIAPNIFYDTLCYFEFCNEKRGSRIVSKNIKEFVEYLENSDSFYIS